jgi:mannitol-specific phosphotransferase system IIBC component
MEAISLIIGVIIGYLVSFIIFSYLFYKYKTKQIAENLKLYTDMRSIIASIESTPEVVDSTATEEMLKDYASIEGEKDGNHS